MLRKSPFTFFLIFCAFLALFTAHCSRTAPEGPEAVTLAPPPSRQQVPEPSNFFTHAESDPYTESLAGNTLPDRVDLFFFYSQDCETCDDLDRLLEILSVNLPPDVRNNIPHNIYMVNTLTTNGRRTYEQVTDSMGLNRLLLSPPLLIVGGRVLQGHETITNNILESFLTAAEDLMVYRRFYNPALRKTGNELFDEYYRISGHVTLVYFHRLACPGCIELRPFLSSIPEIINIEGRQVPMDVIIINTRSGNNNERAFAFFEKYGVPDDQRQVPIIFLADSYLSGAEAIRSNLLQRMSELPRENKLAELIPLEIELAR